MKILMGIGGQRQLQQERIAYNMHVIKYHLKGVGRRYFYWYTPNQRNGSKLKK